jgi:hypothetical protein
MKHDPTLNTLAKGTIVFHATRGKGVIDSGPWGVWFVCANCGADLPKNIELCLACGAVGRREVTGGNRIYEIRFDSNPILIECINVCGLSDPVTHLPFLGKQRQYIKPKRPVGRPRKAHQLSQQAQRIQDQSRWQEALALAHPI